MRARLGTVIGRMLCAMACLEGGVEHVNGVTKVGVEGGLGGVV
jgi:hypothetical protein